MDDKELLEEYISFFGDEPPIPPIHIMKTLVRMKKDGTFDEKMKQKSKMEPLIKKIEELSEEKMSKDHPFFDIDFNRKDTMNISLDDSFELLTDSVINKSTQELVETFNKIGMKEIPFEVSEEEKLLPEFQNGYNHRYRTDNDEECLFEILDKNNEILQVGLEINMNKSLGFSNLEEHFNILKDKCDQKFGTSSARVNGEMTVVQYDGGLLMIGISMIQSENDIVIFKVGNKRLWERIFNEEQK